MTEPSESRGLANELFGALPPRARSIMLYLLMFPLAIAISGMLLQVNVGSLIQESLSKSRNETVDIVSQMLAARVDKMEAKIEAGGADFLQMRDETNELDKRLTLVEREVEQLKRR